MTPTLTPVRPGRHRQMLDFSECHCHCHCHSRNTTISVAQNNTRRMLESAALKRTLRDKWLIITVMILHMLDLMRCACVRHPGNRTPLWLINIVLGCPDLRDSLSFTSSESHRRRHHCQHLDAPTFARRPPTTRKR